MRLLQSGWRILRGTRQADYSASVSSATTSSPSGVITSGAIVSGVSVISTTFSLSLQQPFSPLASHSAPMAEVSVASASLFGQVLPDALLQHEGASAERRVIRDAVPLAQHGPASASVSTDVDVKTGSPVIGQTRQLLPSVELYE